MAATTLVAISSISILELRSGSSERILIIEHDGALRKILQRLFSSEGYVVDVALTQPAVWRASASASSDNRKIPERSRCSLVCYF
jgi:hypothetical protein